MKRRFVIPVVLNLLVVMAVFLVFLFLDINFLTANQPPRHPDLVHLSNGSLLPEGTNGNPDTRNYDFGRITQFDWSPDHYADRNVPNDQTNLMTVRIGGRTVSAAFYSEQIAYYRFEIARFILKGGIAGKSLKVRVQKDGQVIPAFYGPKEIGFLPTASRGESVASWFAGWKPEPGSYEAVLMDGTNAVASAPFEIIARPPVKFNRTVSFITLEWNQQILKRNIFDSAGRKVPFLDGLNDWMDYGELDGFLTLSGETTGWGSITPEKPWEYYPLKNLEAIGKAVHAKNRLVGAYIMCFYTPAQGWKKAGYTAARGPSGTAGGTFVSFKDPKRFRDIAELARYFDSQYYVDFIGFDFIRFGELVGYENASEFVRDMNVDVPANWSALAEADRAAWLASRVKGSTSVLERWKVWIAHKTADFIYRVRREAGIKKPMWVFTLGWDHGTEHGQDPYFFQDAGVFADFVMLYESTPLMFQQMRKDWSAYLKDEPLNYVPGNQIDAVLMKSLSGKNPVEEYRWRMDTAVDWADYKSRGVFIHDISRAFWGRRGGHYFKEWIPAGLSGVSYARWQNGEIPFRLILTNDRVTIRNSSADVPVTVEMDPRIPADLPFGNLTVENILDGTLRNVDISSRSNIIFTVKMDPRKGPVQYLALKGKIEGYPAYFMVNYIKLVSPVAKAVPQATAVNE